jgi:hypothetical protein
MTRLDRLNLGHKIVGESVVSPCRQKYHLEYSIVCGFSKRSYKIHPFFIKLVHIVSRNLLYMYCVLASYTRPQFSTANDRLAMHAIKNSQMFSFHFRAHAKLCHKYFLCKNNMLQYTHQALFTSSQKDIKHA